MPPMTAVLHLFDSDTPPPALDVLESLRRGRPADLTARVGPAAGRMDLPAADHVLRRPWPSALTAGGGLRDLVRRLDIRLVHCWSAALAPLAACVVPGACASIFRPPAARELAACREAARAGAVVLVPSDALRRRLVSGGLPAERLEVLAPAIDGGAGAAARRRDRSRWGLADSQRVLAARAESDADACGFWAVWAVGILHQRAEPFTLLMMGPSGAQQRAAEYAGHHLVSRSIRLVDRPDEALAWAAADAAVLYDTAGFALTSVAAAAAAGAAVIAADAGELCEALVHERTALLVPPETPHLLARAVWRLFNDDGLRDRLVAGVASQLTALRDGAAMGRRVEALSARLARH